MILVLRILFIIVSLGLWQLTQKLLARRNVLVDSTDLVPLNDGLHRLTARWNARLQANPKNADCLLITSSLVIDVLGIYLVISSLSGKSFEPFLALFMVFGLRQICQAFCPLPPPRGMIWRCPGVPSILVTYGTSCDLFFSGHTAIAVLGAITLGTHLGILGIIIGLAIAIFEITTVIILRAHYTIDIFTGVLAALYVHDLAMKLAPHVDHWIAHLSHS